MRRQWNMPTGRAVRGGGTARTRDNRRKCRAKADRKLTRQRSPQRVSATELQRGKEGERHRPRYAGRSAADVSFAQQCLSDGCLAAKWNPLRGKSIPGVSRSLAGGGKRMDAPHHQAARRHRLRGQQVGRAPAARAVPTRRRRAGASGGHYQSISVSGGISRSPCAYRPSFLGFRNDPFWKWSCNVICANHVPQSSL